MNSRVKGIPEHHPPRHVPIEPLDGLIWVTSPGVRCGEAGGGVCQGGLTQLVGEEVAGGRRGMLVGCDKDPNMGSGTLVVSGNALGKVGTYMGGATPDGKDVRLDNEDGTDAEGLTAVGRNGALDGRSDAANGEGVEPNKGGDEPMLTPDNPLAEVNTMPGNGGASCGQ